MNTLGLSCGDAGSAVRARLSSRPGAVMDFSEDPFVRGRRVLGQTQGHYASSPECVPVRPILLPESVYHQSFQTVRDLFRLLQSDAIQLSGGSPRALMHALGARPDDHELLTDDLESELTWGGSMVRADCVFSGGVLKVLEFNVGGAIGGVNLAHNLVDMYRSHGDVGHGRAHFDDPFDARYLLYRDALQATGHQDSSIALLATKRETAYAHPRYWSVEEDFMRTRGLMADFVEPETLAANPDKYKVALRHFMPREWRDMGIDLSLVRAAASAGTLMLAPEMSFLLQNKKLLGLLSSTDRERASDRELVSQHLPWTTPLRALADEVTYKGEQISLSRLVRAFQNDLVLKPASEYGGAGVHIGRASSPEVWDSAVHAALADGRGFVLQEYTPPDPFEMEFVNLRTSRSYISMIYPVFGFILFAGRNSGCLVRHAPAAGQASVVNRARGASSNVCGWFA